LTSELGNKRRDFGLLFHALGLLAPAAYTPEPITSTNTALEREEEEEGAVPVEMEDDKAEAMQDDE
jgi:hypothetical protein